ncbi:MAG: hypothetical protein QOG10_7045 [Kribbellaceae bacterium]|jgi:hypothetical protein|nr:hypothetical protein [Kribbellaceae bacterium]
MRRPLLLALAASFALTACGTTVPLTSQVAGAQSDGTVAGSTGTGTSGTTELGTSGTATTGSTGGALGGTGSSGAAGSTGSATTGGASSTGMAGSGSTGSSATSGGRLITPLRVGVVTTDIGAAVAALGGSSSGNMGPEDGYKAIFKSVNAAGGLAGRRIVATYVKIDALDNSYQQDADKACATFKDARVEVVLSESASTGYGFAACLSKAGVPLLSSNAADNAGLAKAPTVFGAFAPSFDRGYGAVVDKLVASGYLTQKSKIGTVRITCSEVDRAYKSSVLARMKAAHLASPIEYTVSCASGFQDAGAYSAAMQSAVLRFAAAGVDRVFIIGDQETLLLSYFAEQAQSQGYHPGYALSSGSLPITLIGASTFPAQQLPQVHGVGWHPQGDAGLDPKTPAEQRCKALAAKGGIPVKDITTTYVVYQNCSNVFLLEAAMRKGNGSANSSALRATIPALGTSFASTGLIAGATQFGQGRQDGPQLASEWSYITSCNCMKYLGKPSAMR